MIRNNPWKSSSIKMPHAVIYFPRDFELLLANGAIYISVLLKFWKIVFLVSILKLKLNEHRFKLVCGPFWQHD